MQGMYKTIWDEWFTKWCSIIGCDVTQGKTVPETLPYYQFFLIFSDSYNKAEKKIRENRKKNFLWKRIFVVLQCIVVFLQVLITICAMKQFSSGQEFQNYLQVELSLLISWFLLALTIVKIVDIGKYQETWSRHSRFQFLRKQEMIMFLLEEGPYSNLHNDDLARKFIKRILKIEEQNINRFCENMENKEKGLFDEINQMTNTILGKSISKEK